MAEGLVTPGGPPSRRPLHFIWILDCSGSMRAKGKIQALNAAIKEAIPHMRATAQSNPDADMMVRALRFADEATWHIEIPIPVSSFVWRDVDAQGTTALGAALKMVAEQLKVPPMEPRALQPVLALVSDGDPTDEWLEGIAALESQRWGQRALRVAIAIGEDANRDVLTRFMGTEPGLQPLQANNPDALVAMIRWVSTSVLGSASRPQATTPHTPERSPEVVKAKTSGLAIPRDLAKADVDAATVWEATS